MRNWYYQIWADCIIQGKASHKEWKLTSMIFMSLAMGVNLVLIDGIIQRHLLGTNLYRLDIDVFPGKGLDAFLSFFILFMIPPILLNYFLVFHKSRYESFLKKYKTYKGKLFLTYLVLSLSLPLIIILVAKLFLFLRR